MESLCNDNKRKMDFVSYFAGCIGGAAGIIVGQPFDTLKVRLQAQQTVGESRFGHVMQCFHRILQNESVFGLYKGMLSPLMGVSIQNALLFGLQRSILNRFDDSIKSQFYAGTLTGAILCIVSTPVEFSKIQMQVQNIDSKVKGKNSFSGPLHCLKHFYRKEGIRGPMRGFNITLIRDPLPSGLYFYVFSYLNDRFRHWRGQQAKLDLLFAGGVSGCVGWALIYPIDVVKTRIQTDGFLPHGKYKNTFEVFRECYREGYRTFTRGMGVCLIRAFPVNATTFYVVDIIENMTRK